MSEDGGDMQWDDTGPKDGQMQQWYYEDNADSFANEELGFGENDDYGSFE